MHSNLATRVRAAVRAVDHAITFDEPTTLDRIMAEQLVARRMTTGVIGGLAGTALALAALGLYGLLTVQVAARRRDIGLRLALGASPQGSRAVYWARACATRSGAPCWGCCWRSPRGVP